MAILGFNLPRMSDTGQTSNKEIKEIKDYLYQLTDQLRYVLQNIDEENFNDGFSDALSDEIKASLSATDSQIKGISSSLSGLSNSVSSLEKKMPHIEQGTEEAAAVVIITFENEYAEAPYIGFSAVGVSPMLADVAATGATVTIDGEIPEGASFSWVAIGG